MKPQRFPILTTLAVLVYGLSATTSFAQADQTPVDAHPVPAPVAPAQTTTPVHVVPVDPAVPSQVVPTTPPPASTPPAVVTPPTAVPSTSGLNPNEAARDPRALHPLLLPTDSEIKDAIEAGRAFGKTKQDFIDLLALNKRPFQFKNGGLLGERRRETGIVMWVTPLIEAQWLGFIEQRDFADAAKRDADFATIQQRVVSGKRTLTYIVEMNDLFPKHHDQPTQEELDSAYARISSTRFVLSDDHDNNYNPASVIMPSKLIRRQDFYDALSSGLDRLEGNAAFGAPSADSSRLVKRRKSYTNPAMMYIVTFEAFNADGSARVNRDVKKLTLRILTPEEVKYAVFDLSKLP